MIDIGIVSGEVFVIKKIGVEMLFVVFLGMIVVVVFSYFLVLVFVWFGF